jgi:hypothetical protein
VQVLGEVITGLASAFQKSGSWCKALRVNTASAGGPACPRTDHPFWRAIGGHASVKIAEQNGGFARVLRGSPAH